MAADYVVPHPDDSASARAEPLPLRPRELGRLVVDAASAWSADNASRLGAALAYYALFSLAPVLIIISGIVGLVLGTSTDARAVVTPWLDQIIGQGGGEAANIMLSYTSHPGRGWAATLIGVGSLVLGASSLTNELRQSLNALWKIPPPDSSNATMARMARDLFIGRLQALAIVLGAGLLVVASVVANTVLAALGAYVRASLPAPPWLLGAINFLISLGIMSIVFSLVYKFVPDARLAWRDAFVGAALTALMFQVGSLGLSTFLGKTAGSVYGTAGSVLALLVWVYYSTQVFFFGAELTRLFALRFGRGLRPA